MRKISIKWAAISVGIAISGCASQPNEIATQSVSPMMYQHYECDQITMEMDRVGRKTGQLYTSLKKTADNDAAQMGVGLILLWPVLFTLEGGDGPEAAEYARLKGEYEALNQAATMKRCDMRLAKSIDEYIPKEQSSNDNAARAKGIEAGKCEEVEVEPSVWKTVCNESTDVTSTVAVAEPQTIVQPQVIPASNTVDSIEAKLQKVESLYQKGLISETEYQETRGKLLEKLVDDSNR